MGASEEMVVLISEAIPVSQGIEAPVPNGLDTGSIPESVPVPPKSEVFVPEETDVTPEENIVSQGTEIEVCEAALASQIGESVSQEMSVSISEAVPVSQEMEAPVPNELVTGSIPESVPVPTKSEVFVPEETDVTSE